MGLHGTLDEAHGDVVDAKKVIDDMLAQAKEHEGFFDEATINIFIGMQVKLNSVIETLDKLEYN